MVDIVAEKEKQIISRLKLSDLGTFAGLSISPMMTDDQLRAAALDVHAQVDYAELNLLVRSEIMFGGKKDSEEKSKLTEPYVKKIYEICERKGINQVADQLAIANILSIATTTVAKDDMRAAEKAKDTTQFQGIPGLDPIEIRPVAKPTPARTPISGK